MVKDTQILVRLESEQKEKWQNHAEDSDNYRDLTNLIEQAVEQQISEDNDEHSVEDELMLLYSEMEKMNEKASTLIELNKELSDVKADSMEIERATERLENIIMSRENDE